MRKAKRHVKQRGVEGGARFEEVREGSEKSVIALLHLLANLNKLLIAFSVEKAIFTQYISQLQLVDSNSAQTDNFLTTQNRPSSPLTYLTVETVLPPIFMISKVTQLGLLIIVTR